MDRNFYVETDRIGLRKFCPDDLNEFARINSDPQVMAYFPKPMTREECRQWMDRINDAIETEGFSFWAAEHLVTCKLMGCVGISRMNYETEFTPAVEVGWRLDHAFWGQGLASEAATASLKFAFEEAGLQEIVSFTALINERSWRVMERIGMTQVDQFNHPKVPSDHRLQPHVLYKITSSEFFPAASKLE